MQEYMDNGAQLGWLIDPQNRRIHVYRPGAPVEVLEDPATLSGDPVLPGFVLDVQAIFKRRFGRDR
jgi:Uma2 family endonuclease